MTTGRPGSPHRCSPGRRRASRCWSAARGSVPDPTAQALAQLDPEGGGPSGDVAVYSTGGAAVPSGLTCGELHGDSPAEIANSIDQLRQRLMKQRTRSTSWWSAPTVPGYAMPAAAWAARSGDPVLFTGRNQVPSATLAALRRHAAAAVYVLGPESVISKAALTADRPGLRERAAGRRHRRRCRTRSSSRATRTGRSAGTSTIPVTGWSSPTRTGRWTPRRRPRWRRAASGGPLLVTDTADALPPELRSFLLDIKPGYATDPTRAVYNHIWLMGDATAIGGQVQAEVDELAELAPIASAAGPGNRRAASPSRAASRANRTRLRRRGRSERGGATRPADEAGDRRGHPGPGRTRPPRTSPSRSAIASSG